MSKLIKWSGSKESQSKEILKYIPNDIKTYYEPFVGGGSIFLNLLEERNIEKYVISDINSDLINIYNFIKNNPELMIEKYNKHYINFNSGDINNRKEYFNQIRKRYNKERNPYDFYWIMRTTTNGMPRYNRNGDFNNSCHFSRPGMKPEAVNKLITYWSKKFNDNDIDFISKDFKNIDYNGFVYLDPPYENTKGMYFGNFINKEFIDWLDGLNSDWLLSYDGKVNNMNIDHIKPKNYDKHIYLNSGNSSFRRVIGKDKNSNVEESLYIKIKNNI